MTTRTPQSRAGFTLPELMVAAAMSLVIMAILAVAFQRGIDAFRTLRAVGQLQDRLRSAQNVIHRDLAAEHFGGLFQPGFSGPYVRDQRLDLVGWMPPDEGYFEFRQAPGLAGASVEEGVDSDNLPSYFADGTQAHSLRFTVKLTGKRQEDWFYAPAGGTLFPTAVWNVRNVDFSSQNNATDASLASRWAEICYFLSPTGDDAKGTPLFSLRRQQKLLLSSPQGTFSSPSSVARNTNTDPNKRNGGTTYAYAASSTGDDILLTDVLSFQIRGAWNSNLDGSIPATVSRPPLDANANPDYPFGDLREPTATGTTAWGRRFDTGSRLDATTYDWSNPTFDAMTPTGAPINRVRMSTLQIRVRIWDKSTQTTRQMTIIQDI